MMNKKKFFANGFNNNQTDLQTATGIADANSEALIEEIYVQLQALVLMMW